MNVSEVTGHISCRMPRKGNVTSSLVVSTDSHKRHSMFLFILLFTNSVYISVLLEKKLFHCYWCVFCLKTHCTALCFCLRLWPQATEKNSLVLLLEFGMRQHEPCPHTVCFQPPWPVEPDKPAPWLCVCWVPPSHKISTWTRKYNLETILAASTKEADALIKMCCVQKISQGNSFQKDSFVSGPSLCGSIMNGYRKLYSKSEGFGKVPLRNIFGSLSSTSQCLQFPSDALGWEPKRKITDLFSLRPYIWRKRGKKKVFLCFSFLQKKIVLLLEP